ncbi:MAG: cytidine deaminase [Calothrix sp. MO_192.B10]|nr:cytidine deaminase [Calothrix sp. MO_192.B10]
MTHVTLEQAIAKVPLAIQSELRTILDQHAVIDSSVITSWLDRLGIDIDTLMIELLPVAAIYARVPISNFYVGAIALGKPKSNSEVDSGNLYFGANMEFVGQALSFSVHGEQSATTNAWLHGETGLQALAINAAPCGYCRQFLYEMATVNQDFVILLKANKAQSEQTYTSNILPYFLPEAFGPADLGLKGGLMETVFHGLETCSTDDVVLAALSAANQSYAPYTKNFAGVALKDSHGNIFTGRYAENAAYNPSMSPMESALTYMNMNKSPQSLFDICDAVLVEVETTISQRPVTEAVLSSISPRVVLRYVPATLSSNK